MTGTVGHSGKIVIDAWLHYYKTPHFLDQTAEIAKRFNDEHPDYHVNVSRHDYVTIPGEIAEAATRGVRPAIAQYYSTSSQLARDMRDAEGKPLFTSVVDAIGGRTEVLGVPVTVDGVHPTARDYFTQPDGFTSLCTLSSTTLLYANMEMIQAAGVEEIPRTWQELETACKAVAALRDGPSHAVTWVCHGWMFQQAVACQGGLLVDHDNGRSGQAETVDLASDEMMAYVDWWRRLHRDGHYLYTGVRMTGPGTDVPEGHLLPWGASFEAFTQGRTAFLITSSVDASRVVQVGRERGFTARACRLPYNADVPFRGNVLGGDSLWLGNGLDEATRDGALAFMLYLNTPDNAVARHDVSNYMPITNTAVERLDRDGWFTRHPHRRMAVAQLDASDLSPAAQGPLAGELPRVQDLLTEAMHDVLVADADPAVRFSQATADAQRLLDDYNAHGPTNYRVH